VNSLSPASRHEPPASVEAMQGPLFALRTRIAAGEIMPDPAQAFAAERLQALWNALLDYDPKPLPDQRPSLFARLGLRKKVEEHADAPSGLYLVGEVGRGKSMLMDLFFGQARVTRKRRTHFHQFMQAAHGWMHRYRQADPDAADPIPPLATEIAKGAALLCFDEFQVHDIADAMVLGRLFQALFERGVVVVATSNTLPDDLYRDGLQREAFRPFIELLKTNLEVLQLGGARDYRRQRIRGLATWHTPIDRRADDALDRAWTELTEAAQPKPDHLSVLGRDLLIPAAAGGVARFEFDALCGQALGPADYLAIATHFETVLLDGVPRLGPQNFDRARRFITLIDTLYEHRVKLVASAADSPDRIYERGDNAAMFRRTASRLEEMQSAEYLALPHLP